MNNKTDKRHTYLWAIVNLKCPHCRQGNMFLNAGYFDFKNFMKMHDKCPVCGQKTELEDGFYEGTGYVSYALAVAFSVSTFVAWWVLIGFSVDDNRVFWWLGINAILLLLIQPYIMRFSRIIWLTFFVSYDADWQLQ